MIDPLSIFSTRVQNYLAYRPGYPPALLDLLRTECRFSDAAVIADVGSGTGLLSELFLKNGNRVFGVEPNSEMRDTGKNRLSTYPGFVSVAAKAEATTLESDSLDFITAGQAFHWFDLEQAKEEFARILKPNGWVVVVYNIARTDTAFLTDYQLFCAAYLGEKGSEVEDVDIYTSFYGKGGFTQKRVDGVCQSFDFIGLTGRVLSRANLPEAGFHQHSEMLKALKSIFENHQQDGKVMISYVTDVVYGQLPNH